MIAFSRPFLPLFLHVLGAMTLFGTFLATAVLASARKPRVFPMLLVVGLPAWLVTFAAGIWIAAREGVDKADPTWLTIGHVVLEPGGIVFLLGTIGVAYWWTRSGKPVAGRIVAGLSSVYLLLLAVAWLAMSGKWG